MKSLPRRIVETRRLLRGATFDLVHAVDWPSFIPLRLACGLLRGARRLRTTRGAEIIYMHSVQPGATLAVSGSWRNREAEWVANDRYTADLLRAHFPQIPEARLSPITLGLSPKWMQGSPKREVAQQELAVSPDRTVIVSFGRVFPCKGHSLIAEALARSPPELAQRMEWWVIGLLIDPSHAASLLPCSGGVGGNHEVTILSRGDASKAAVPRG